MGLGRPPLDDQDALRLVQMSLEVGDVGPLLDRAMDQVPVPAGSAPFCRCWPRSPRKVAPLPLVFASS